MVGCSYINKYLDERDANNVRIGDWAEQGGQKGVAICKVCVPRRTISFKSHGAKDLIKHSMSDLHKNCAKAAKSQQASLTNFFQNDEHDKLQKEIKSLEIALLSFMGRHGIPTTLSDCLNCLLKKHITDSKIVEGLTLGARKARYVTIYGLGEYFEKETISELRNCDAFSISIDESEVNKKSELEIMVRMSDKDGIKNKHYKSIDLEAGDATTIKESVIETFIEDRIDYQSKLLDVGADGCNTMQGVRSGVVTKFKEEVKEFYATGSCNSHNCGNALKHGVAKFDPDMTQALVNIYILLGGHKGRGLKRKHMFESHCKDAGFIPKAFKRFVETRFCIMRDCIEPVLHNIAHIRTFLSKLKKPSDREKKLQKYFVDNFEISKLKLMFVFDASAELIEGIKHFESKEAQIHNTGDKLETLLVGQYRKVFHDSVINTLDEDDNLERKSRRELMNVDLDEAMKLSKKNIYIGHRVEQEIKKLGLSPSSSQLSWFFEAVEKFHLKVCSDLKKYFKTALTSDVIENLSALSPKAQRKYSTPRKLKNLVNQYSKVVDNIKSVDGMNLIREEIAEYVTDEDVQELDKNVDYEKYWLSVGEISDNSDGKWKRYEVLPRFALAMGTKYDANGDVERQFSVMNSIHQNVQRNRMSQETLDALLHIRSGIESKENLQDCDKCKKHTTPHCHCSVLDISQGLIESCKVAWRKEKEECKDRRDLREEDDEDMMKRRRNFEEKESNRSIKMKEAFAKGNPWKKDQFLPIYKSKTKDNNNDNKEKDTVENEKKRKGDGDKDKNANSSKKTKNK